MRLEVPVFSHCFYELFILKHFYSAPYIPTSTRRQILITAAMHVGHALADEFIRVRIIEEWQRKMKLSSKM